MGGQIKAVLVIFLECLRKTLSSRLSAVPTEMGTGLLFVIGQKGHSLSRLVG